MNTQQVLFKVDSDDTTFGGILVNEKYIICGCCGGVFEVADEEITIIKRFDTWVNISDEIKGE